MVVYRFHKISPWLVLAFGGPFFTKFISQGVCETLPFIAYLAFRQMRCNTFLGFSKEETFGRNGMVADTAPAELILDTFFGAMLAFSLHFERCLVL
jgi:hypothetical protein